MKIRAVMLDRMGAVAPYAQTRPLSIREIDLAPPAIRDLTGGGVDLGFEMAGSARAASLAFEVVGRGGSTIIAGLAPPDARLPLPLVQLVAEERSVKGSYIGTCVPMRDVPRYIAMHRKGILPVEQLVSGRLKLEEINQGFDRLRDGHAVRQIITMQ